MNSQTLPENPVDPLENVLNTQAPIVHTPPETTIVQKEIIKEPVLTQIPNIVTNATITPKLSSSSPQATQGLFEGKRLSRDPLCFIKKATGRQF
jgi:hypothetical protein